MYDYVIMNQVIDVQIGDGGYFLVMNRVSIPYHIMFVYSSANEQLKLFLAKYIIVFLILFWGMVCVHCVCVNRSVHCLYSIRNPCVLTIVDMTT